MWALCSAAHVKGTQYVEADSLSRLKNLGAEWMLKPHVFHGLCDMVSVPAIDLFASRINAQVATYVSWPLEPAALFINAFSIHWGDRISYAFSLFSLIARVLRTLQEDRASMVAFFASVAVTSLVPQGPSVTCSATSPPPLHPRVIPAETAYIQPRGRSLMLHAMEFWAIL